ncbi:hypothetical protein UFOVP816_3 [uncultured Caudovirales phage]|uniref:Uncharacterized protein n=1 Tax=uncultured Caudovirales phage TaxID=2100421 RepID=A0A6J5P4Z6_9CAUD|nr:hypothetical protein UFOVP816_3 [uncultured Caudovirales phage]
MKTKEALKEVIKEKLSQLNKKELASVVRVYKMAKKKKKSKTH